MTIYYTSDHHFHHNNMIRHENRPYEGIEEMNEDLISKWNCTVNKNDTVYHLGDLCFGSLLKWESIVNRLNGKIILIKGNHDNEKVLNKIGHKFESIENMVVRKINNNHLFLFHYPIEIGLTSNAYSICGHIHSKPNTHINQINVGIDSTFIENSVGFGNLISEDELLINLDVIKDKIMTLREERK